MLKVNAKNLGTVAVLALQGRIVVGETEPLRSAVQVSSQTRTVILDLARVTVLDAHGLGALLELRERFQTQGICLELMNVSKPLSRVFEIARLDSVFPIIAGVEFFPRIASARPSGIAMLKSCA
jgi:anti-sigma B factor antagonist